MYCLYLASETEKTPIVTGEMFQYCKYILIWKEKADRHLNLNAKG